MRRGVDNVPKSSQHKQPAASSRIAPTRQFQTSTTSPVGGLTSKDVLTYVKTVKEVFHDRKDKYDEFINVMKDFKAQRINTAAVMSKVKELFKGHRDLILGFNAFLPKGCEISPSPEEEPVRKKGVEYKEALKFVAGIKTRFPDHVYKAFIDILNLFKNDRKSITEVYNEISILFKDHVDVIVDFARFLPDLSGNAHLRPPEPSRNPIPCEDNRDSPLAIAKTVEKYPSQPVVDLRNHVEKENKEGREKIELGKGDNLDHKKSCAREDDPATSQFHRGMQGPEFVFLDKVNKTIQDAESRNKILDCIRPYKSQLITADQFQTMVTSLIGTHADLMEACDDFITYSEKTGCLRSNKQAFKSSKVDENFDASGRNKTKDDDDDGERERYDRGHVLNTKDVLEQKPSSHANKEYLMKPIQELDLSNCESCTPSYRLLPDNVVIPPANWRTKIGDEVLNDRWVSVTSGSEDYSFKHMRKNQYEESLFRCEDDRFELDMLLESANTTVKRVEELLNSIDNHTIKLDDSFHIEDHLTALDLRCIEHLYGDHGVDVLEVLRKSATFSLPVVLSRLKQKQVEWAKCRMEFNKVWADTYAKNYHKSLDHRSFYFKQQDTKNLSAKALLAEIKEISERYQNEDEMVLVDSSGHKKPMRPDMEFEYPDPDIQDDMYHLIKYSCGELCTPEQRDKIMKIWTTFLELVFGIPSHPPSAEDNENHVKVDNDIAKNGDGNSEENDSPVGATTSFKRSNSSRSGEECSLTEHPCSSQVLMSHGNSPVKNGSSPGTDFVTSQSDRRSNCPQSENMKTCNSVMSDKSWAGKHAGSEKDCPNTARGKSIDDDVSTINRGPPCTKPNHGIEGMPTQELEDGVIKQITSSSKAIPEDVKIQTCHEASEIHSKIDWEEGELSPDKDMDEKRTSACGNTGTEEEQSLYKVDPSIRRSRGDTNDEGEESAHGSSESENASEIGDVSASQSPNVEECSPEEPDDDGDNDENVNKAEHEVEADNLADVHDTEGTIPFSDCFLQTVKPLTMKMSMSHHGNENNSQIFYGNDSFYLLFRFHQILYARMQSAKLHASSPENKWRILNNANSEDSYARFKDALCSLLNGSSDNAKFEDECRAIIGAQSYILFTLDKLIQKLIKQLQTISTDEMDNKLLLLYAYERSRSPGTFHDKVYYQNACFLLPEDNLYRIECFPCPTRLTIQVMKNEQDKLDPKATSMDPKFETYLNEVLSAVPRVRGRARAFLKRNIKKFSSGDEALDFQRAMEGVIVRNGLETRINCSSSKASYVVGTEDIFYRVRKRNKKSQRKTGNRFSIWCIQVPRPQGF
ncbi:paired amphipathic helix protein Sin3-like 3 isoform X2 [Andrographis paniculata]|uniref:paired amphipathic helix protein Sin3-like 3 isoform X2 n=1 Tax=Andrographis paniculata TaxID=175694 RepID=UPI0021E936E8|nr:paired amphipathic helix protein Sin3-like 3 isoform X2 [Andrographis paniculata]